MPFCFQRFLGFLQSARGQVLRSEERKAPRRFLAVAAINPKLRVISTVTLVKSADPAIAGIADRHKLGEMILEKRLRLLCVDRGSWRQSLIRIRLSFHCFTLHGETPAGVAELADAPDLGSGGEIRRGSSPLPGSFPRIRSCAQKEGFSQPPGHAIIRGAVGRNWHLMTCILEVAGIAIATVTSRLFSPLALSKNIFLHFTTKRSPRNPIIG